MAATISIGGRPILLQFYKDDLRFLYHLIDKYFMGLTLNANLDEMRELKALFESSACDALIEKTALHLKHLAELIDAPYNMIHQCRTEHEKLEIEIDDFVKKFQENKKEIFAITEKVMKKRFKRLLP
jgi:predicted RNA-binding protein Jag